MMLRRSASGIVHSAITRLPRVCRMLICDGFLSVSMLPLSEKFRISPGKFAVIHSQAAFVALPHMFWPAASPVV